MTSKIFINYRRDDSIGTAGRLHDRLAQTFGRKNLFMDVDHIPAGVDFVNHLNSQVSGCDIFLVIIGPNWVNAQDDHGRRRLDNSDDFVVVEIAAALARNICVIPVLVDGSPVPRADELPDAIKPLARRNAVEVRNTQFGRDAEALVDKIREALGGPRPAARLWPSLASAATRLMGLGRWRSVVASAAPLLVVGWMGYQVGVPTSSAWTPRTERPDAAAPEKVKAADEARRKAEDAERQRQAALRAEEERRAKAAAEADAKRKADELERQRQATLRVEEERRAKAAAEAEAKRKADEAERQRLAEADRLARQSRVEFSDGDYNRAIATASEAMRLDPKSTLAFLSRGDAYMKKGDDDRAIADFNEAIRLNPKFAHAFEHRGFAYGHKNDVDRAIADFNEAIRLDPNNAVQLSNRGNAYIKKGDNDRAIADYNEAIRLDPTLARAFTGRGFAYMRKGSNNQAMADYNEAIRLRPDFAAGAYCNRGRLKLQLNQASGNSDIAKARQLGGSDC
jgi:tetratricopeptide (TPR) repeat protein